MIHPQLVSFIRLQVSMGVSEEDIRKALATGSWTPMDIDEAFAAVRNPASISAPIKPEVGGGYQNVAPQAAASASFANTSGQGKAAVVPPEVKRWNWGAFGFNWIWGIGNGTHIALLCLIPLVNLVMIFVLGAKGSEWAWRNERWESVEHFKRVQRRWAITWVIFLLVGIALFGTLVGISLTSLSTGREKARDATRLLNLDEIRLDLTLYDSTNRAYPTSLDQLAPEFAQSIPVDPLTQAPYQYEASGTSYKLCATLEEAAPPASSDPTASFSNGEYCVVPNAQ